MRYKEVKLRYRSLFLRPSDAQLFAQPPKKPLVSLCNQYHELFCNFLMVSGSLEY